MILVTGGAGFIGSHLVCALVRQRRAVRVLDDFSTGKEHNLASVIDQIEVVHGSVVDPRVVEQAMKGVRLVYHEAARPSVVLSFEQPALVHEVNATGTLNVLEAARRAKVERLVLASSSSVYGDPEVNPSTEEFREDPKSPYAAQKLISEHYCRIYAASHGLSTVVLRYYNVFGPRQDPLSPYSGVISIFCDRMLRGQIPAIQGDGEQTRDFTYVDDVVSANLLAATAALEPGAVVNVATGRSISILHLFEVVARELGLEVRPRFLPARTGDIRHSVADISRAVQWLGYRPSVAFEAGLRATLDWARLEIAEPVLEKPS